MSQLKRLGRVLFTLKQKVRALNRKRLERRRITQRPEYSRWLEFNDCQASPMTQVVVDERVCVLITCDPTSSGDGVAATLRSLSLQTHADWSALVVGLAVDQHAKIPHDPRWQITGPDRNASWPVNSAWVLQLLAGDLIHPQAIEWMLCAGRQDKAAIAVYADHDHQSADGVRHAHAFKPEWDPDLHLATGYAAHMCLLRHQASLAVAPEQWCTDEALIRLWLSSPSMSVQHVPAVLLHRCKEPSCREEGHGATRAERISEVLTSSRSRLRVQNIEGCRALNVVWPELETWPMVSVIIPTKDQLHLLRKCVDSLRVGTDYPQLEIIIVDNGSSENATLKYLDDLKAHDAGVKVVRDDRPFNYARLNNLAANHHARGQVLALLNNDIEAIEPNWLKCMVTQAMRPEIGCVGARLLYGNRTIQHGGVLLGISKDWHRHIGIAAHAFKGLTPEAPGYMDRAQACQRYSAVTAACMVIRRDVYAAVGGMDEANLAVAYNDVDLCLRVKELGLHNLWTPRATLIHHESISRGRDLSPEKLARLASEARYMRARWGHILHNDPAYNPNLSLARASFELSIPSRSPYSRQ